MAQPLQIVWFKRDLRVQDHGPLAAAAARGVVLPLYVIEPEYWRQPDVSARQWSFVRECLVELDAALRDLGQPLVLRTGSITDVLTELAAEHEIAALWSHEETGSGWTFERDKAVNQWCRAHGIDWHEQPQHGVVRRLDSRDGWAKRWDTLMAEERAETPTSLTPLLFTKQANGQCNTASLPAPRDLGLNDDCCPDRQLGGRQNGLALLDSFLHERGRNYRTAMSSPITATNECSRLSAHLAAGTVSMREVAQATWQRQHALKEVNDRTGWRSSLRSFNGRLHWHCHFMQKLEDEPGIEFRNLHRAYDNLRPAGSDATRLAAWCAGETGWPFVDACMRSLQHTGWLNFRMRAMLIAVASYHLWLDWRAPGEHLARLFTDYEPGIHWPQVQMQSGTTGINTPRIYNPVKQGHDQDPDGAFVRRWVPELAEVPDAFIHEPWRWDGAAGLLDTRYPAPVVDHLEAAKAARQKIWALRKSDDYRREAQRIQQKHGSRKSGN